MSERGSRAQKVHAGLRFHLIGVQPDIKE